jgi:hypothetical protein
MSSSRPKPFQTLANLAARPFRLAAPLRDLLHEPQTFQTAAGGGEERKVVDGWNRRRVNTPILRAEGRTRVHRASAGLDARRKGKVTVFCAVFGSIPSGFARRERRS